MTLLLAVYENQPIAGVILFKFKDKVIPEFIADDGKFRNLCPNHFLIWEAIKLAYENNYKIFSFGRTAKNNNGLMVFKNRWGTRVVDFQDFFYPSSACDKNKEKVLSLKYKLIKKTSEKAPNFLFKMIGNFCYRHLG